MNKNYNLSKYKIVYCDDYNALQWAYKNSLSKSAIIKTYSPKIYYENLHNVKKMNKALSIEENKKIINLYQIYLNELKNELLKFLSYERTIFLIHKIAFFKRVIEKVIDLSFNELNNQVLYIKIQGNSGPEKNEYLKEDNILNAPWVKIIENHKNFTTINYNYSNNYIYSNFDKFNLKNIYRRIKIAGFQSLIYRIFIKLNKYLPKFIFKKQILIFNENELLIDTAYKMFLSGYAIKSIKYLDKNKKKKLYSDSFITNEIKNIIQKNTRNFLRKIIDKNFIDSTVKLLYDHLSESLKLFENKYRYFDLALKNINKKNLIFTSSPYSGNCIPLYLAAKKNNIPFIVFQHGVSLEIEEFDGGDFNPHESSLSDIYFAFNSASINISDKIKSFGSKYVSGMSSRHLRVINSSKNKKKSIVYISTGLNKGNYGWGVNFFSDIDIIYYELELIKKVFIKTDINFLYKMYPEVNSRYLDGNPIKDYLIKYNINYYNGFTDMRYMIDDFNIFITKGATSTLTWPLLSNKPLIFINSLKKPIKSELKNLFNESIFYFEENDPQIYDKLNNLINMELEEINNIYFNKRKNRSFLINQYFNTLSTHRAFKICKDIINK